MVMHGNVDDELTFDKTKLEVCGPIFWDGLPAGMPATELTLVSVTVVAWHGPPRSVSPGTVLNPGANPVEWMAEIPGDWAAGAATVTVAVLPTTGRGSHQPQEHWTARVSLRPA